jgi:hypothetical protein
VCTHSWTYADKSSCLGELYLCSCAGVGARAHTRTYSCSWPAGSPPTPLPEPCWTVLPGRTCTHAAQKAGAQQQASQKTLDGFKKLPPQTKQHTSLSCPVLTHAPTHAHRDTDAAPTGTYTAPPRAHTTQRTHTHPHPTSHIHATFALKLHAEATHQTTGPEQAANCQVGAEHTSAQKLASHACPHSTLACAAGPLLTTKRTRRCTPAVWPTRHQTRPVLRKLLLTDHTTAAAGLGCWLVCEQPPGKKPGHAATNIAGPSPHNMQATRTHNTHAHAKPCRESHAELGMVNHDS